MIINFAQNSILHIDADSFFASVEVAHNPGLRNRPVCVLAANAPCILAATYEAKRLGVRTAMSLYEAKKKLPVDAVYIPATFSRYALYSSRMFAIIRRFSPVVEEYSIDEAFVDLSGLRRLYKKSYREIGKDIVQRIQEELGIPVSIGIAPTRTLAKIASARDKPQGVCEVPRKDVVSFLKDISISSVPGIGTNTVALLQKQSVYTASDFVHMHEGYVKRLLGRPGMVLWNEMRGQKIVPVSSEKKAPKSISRIRSFPVTEDIQFLKQHLIYHIALCSYKLRRMQMATSRIYVYIRDEQYSILGEEWNDTKRHASAHRFISHTLDRFEKMISGKKARSVGVVFGPLYKNSHYQLSLFSEDNAVRKEEALLQAADRINAKYGLFTVRPAGLVGSSAEQPHLSIPFL